ncbi:MAG: alpha/beta hydrolase [Scytonematopsis contorta HA4267-MV1]|jgi:pimeloyl-ACP methyl ester carboxylesterase|nr:alpha/beta hydrolase [Scytonematopsis contorta HA4267-MV1]
MSELFNVIYLSTSPSLKHFDQPLVRYLSEHLNIAQWEYIQTLDEGSSIDKAVELLYSFLKQQDSPTHLIGHGISGVVALTFARRYPQLVKSLTLLAVSAKPAMTWHSHYYLQRQALPANREQVLVHTVTSLFGNQPPYPVNNLVTALGKDLEKSPNLHSLFKLANLPQGGVSMPLMVCGSKTDSIVNPPALYKWQNWLKSEDKIWECPDGYHFFHFLYPDKLGQEILGFWQSFDPLLFSGKIYQRLYN